MSPWTWAWIGWGVYFAVVEGMALFNSRPGDTLSEHVWAWLGYAATGQGRCGAEPDRHEEADACSAGQGECALEHAVSFRR